MDERSGMVIWGRLEKVVLLMGLHGGRSILLVQMLVWMCRWEGCVKFCMEMGEKVYKFQCLCSSLVLRFLVSPPSLFLP